MVRKIEVVPVFLFSQVVIQANTCVYPRVTAVAVPRLDRPGSSWLEHYGLPVCCYRDSEMVTLQELVRATRSERAAEAFSVKESVLVRFWSCPWCRSKRVWRVRRGRYTCGGCRREWSVPKGSGVEDTRVDLVTLVLAVKLFALEHSAHRAAKELGLCDNTTDKLFMRIRQALAAKVKGGAQKAAGEVEMDGAYFEGTRRGKLGRGVAGKIPVFGILERGGKVRVEVLPDVSSASLPRLAVAEMNGRA